MPEQLYVITGQGLDHGCPVYLTEGKEWKAQPAEPTLFHNKEEAENMLGTLLTHRTIHILDPYLIAVTYDGGKIIPVHIKERIRMQGPTVPLVTFPS